MTEKQSFCLDSYNRALVNSKKLFILTSAGGIIGSPVVNSSATGAMEYIYLKDVASFPMNKTSSLNNPSFEIEELIVFIDQIIGLMIVDDIQ
ncbi:MAG: hypothetical protein ACI38A_01885 [Candidatus Ornithomonoglobus sp.]